jgi:hypothetical protein
MAKIFHSNWTVELADADQRFDAHLKRSKGESMPRNVDELIRQLPAARRRKIER